SEAARFVAAGLVAAILIAPFALDLRAARHDSASPIEFDIRRTGAFEWCFDQLGVSRSQSVRVACNIPLLPLCYFLEFGAFAIGAGAYWWIRRRQGGALTDDEWFQIILVAVP